MACKMTQLWPQPPQWSGLLLVLTQLPLQSVSEPQLMPQLPPLQVGLPGLGSGHTLLQTPQWDVLLSVLTQALPHLVRLPHVKVQALPIHAGVPPEGALVHLVPQPLQLLTSFVVLTQALPHLVRLPQVKVQALLIHAGVPPAGALVHLVPHALQLLTSFVVLTQALPHLAKEPPQLNVQLLPMQAGVPPDGALVHLVPQPPQLFTVVRASSQPSLGSPSQSPQLPWQVGEHLPALHSVTACKASHLVPQAPQLPVSVCVLISQPLRGSLSQSSQFVLQLFMTHLPSSQAAAALGKLHEIPHSPQLFTSVRMFVSQTSFRSQSASPVGQFDCLHSPPLHTIQVGPLTVQSLPQLPQFNGFVFKSVSQPSVAPAEQSANPGLHSARSQASALHLALAFGMLHGSHDVPPQPVAGSAFGMHLPSQTLAPTKHSPLMPSKPPPASVMPPSPPGSAPLPEVSSPHAAAKSVPAPTKQSARSSRNMTRSLLAARPHRTCPRQSTGNALVFARTSSAENPRVPPALRDGCFRLQLFGFATHGAQARKGGVFARRGNEVFEHKLVTDAADLHGSLCGRDPHDRVVLLGQAGLHLGGESALHGALKVGAPAGVFSRQQRFGAFRRACFVRVARLRGHG